MKHMFEFYPDIISPICCTWNTFAFNNIVNLYSYLIVYKLIYFGQCWNWNQIHLSQKLS